MGGLDLPRASKEGLQNIVELSTILAYSNPKKEVKEEGR
jgi:hypothetical protein